MNPVPFTSDVRSTGAHPKRLRQITRHMRKLALVIGAAGLLSCHEAPYWQHLVIGAVDFDEPAWPSPQIPETAIVGEPLPVTVWTGDRGCSEYAFTRGGATGQSGSIIPYDYLTLTEGIDCADDLQFIEHRTTLVFDEPETAEITVWYSVGRMDRPEEYMGDGRKVYTVEVKEAG